MSSLTFRYLKAINLLLGASFRPTLIQSARSLLDLEYHLVSPVRCNWKNNVYLIVMQEASDALSKLQFAKCLSYSA